MISNAKNHLCVLWLSFFRRLRGLMHADYEGTVWFNRTSKPSVLNRFWLMIQSCNCMNSAVWDQSSPLWVGNETRLFRIRLKIMNKFHDFIQLQRFLQLCWDMEDSVQSWKADFLEREIRGHRGSLMASESINPKVSPNITNESQVCPWDRTTRGTQS